MIKAIGFDLDDTLYDRNSVYRRVFENMQDHFPADISFEVFNSVYQAYSKSYYRAYMNGDCDKLYYQLQRTIDSYRDFDYTIDNELAQKFLDLYEGNKKELELRPYFHDCLVQLKQSPIEIFVLTNGARSGQSSKISSLKLNQYFDPNRMWISEDLGCSKPASEIFEQVTQRLGYQANEILYVGDDLTNDIKGSLDHGWQALYFNVHNKPADIEHPHLSIAEDESSLYEQLLAYI